MTKACQLFSGSSGNSIFIANDNTKILVDAGVTAKRLDEAFSNIGENPKDLSAIFITHEHSDHIAGVRVFATRHNIPVFAERDVLDKMYSAGHITDKIIADSISDNMELGGIEIVPFYNSHDSVKCVGYRFNMGNKSVSICTDTGYITDDARKALLGSTMVYLESNHEERMLLNGSYPYPLKQRILSDRGHLSNSASAEFATELVQNGTTRLVLAHLSKENNLPDLARQTAVSTLENAGLKLDEDYLLRVSKEINNERPIIL